MQLRRALCSEGEVVRALARYFGLVVTILCGVQLSAGVIRHDRNGVVYRLPITAVFTLT